MGDKIEFLSLQKINAGYTREYLGVLSKILEDGWYILGKNVNEFEKEYASFSRTGFCVGVANGLDALILSLRSLEIGQGDEVIVPSNTYIASWLAISQVGAIPVPVEPRIDTYNLNPDLIEAAITPATKAVMAVNLYGQAAELGKIKKICNKHKIYLVEDNAQSQGATCEGLFTGSFGIINATSFYPGKNLGALGDAGAITTNDEDIAEKIKIFRNYGSRVKYFNEVRGYNSRLDELQAGFLRIKLQHLKEENIYRQRCSDKYHELLQSIEGLILPVLAEACTSVQHIFLVRTDRRNELQKYLASHNIGTMIHYPVPPHLQTAYKELGYKKGDFPVAEIIAETCLSLPMGTHLSMEEIEFVAREIACFFKIQ
ncbi:MAG: DegT/DnrJ/EryC1/StrS family aminotransferase [Chitinophagaceae bacterium]|nr:DegT/DnrJ/EryC1/StrS family aminotransferase [Chitinophagaceae bacterium]